ncbi:Glutathione S-transferase C-terminal domain-containing protein [Sciurus carolinensis]|uniref:Glutathione S-transferase C-terminal domain-containing protein n=1 Tax=Sciurus carolinensis TaxID=30640 RepID=A0AA41N922_SCICA|nr:Glutathione S-transferase C-terminal domain-containing protein [Sciurus carolinensis]
MKGIKKSLTEEYLYLNFSHQTEGCIFPLHTAVTLFLLSYCDCKIFKVCLVLTEENTDIALLRDVLSQDVEIQVIPKQELPPIVQNCCLPAVVERPDSFCRAGLAVVLRHIIQKSYEADPSKKEILELLGFKKTCLKACAEVSQWTRLCELTIPLAIENFLRESSDQLPTIPTEVLQLEKKLSEPVRVHNDDKLRRQKLKQQRAAAVKPTLAKGKAKSKVHALETSEELDSSSKSLELQMAFSKLRVQEEPATTNREPSHIRKAKPSDLPPLEHVFAEGLYFTLADIVLMPCIHHFLGRPPVFRSGRFESKQLTTRLLLWQPPVALMQSVLDQATRHVPPLPPGSPLVFRSARSESKQLATQLLLRQPPGALVFAPSPSTVLSHLLYDDPSCPCSPLQWGEGCLAGQLYFTKFPVSRDYRPIRDTSPVGETHPTALSWSQVSHYLLF